MAGKFGEKFNLADWWIRERSAKLNSANIYMFGGWGFTTSARICVRAEE